jgi:hypothetical protein
MDKHLLYAAGILLALIIGGISMRSTKPEATPPQIEIEVQPNPQIEVQPQPQTPPPQQKDQLKIKAPFFKMERTK